MAEDRIHGSWHDAFVLQAAVLAVLAATISILWAVYFRTPDLRFDENYYYPLAENILAGRYVDGYVIRAPLYPLFLAGIFKLFGTGFLPALIAQGILRGLVVATVAWLGRRYVSRRAGLTAALLLTFCPALISAYMSFLTEAVYIPLFLASFYFIDRASESERVSGAFGAGLASGAAALARATSFFLAIILAVWFAVGKSRAGRLSWPNMSRAALLIVALFTAISPWTIRNAVVHKGFIAVSDDSAFNLWLITSGMKIREAIPEWTSWGTHPERQREAYSRWLAYLREDPAFHIKRLGVVLPRIFSTSWESPAGSLSTLYRGERPREVAAIKSAVSVLHPATMWIIFAGGLAGLLALERKGRRRTLVLLVVAYFILIHGATLARARFMLPVVCLLSVYSGGLVSTGIDQLCHFAGRRPHRPV
jgi:4-amino-4-deoxy-L-arabinose transferase-like glycosyltransferase